jgi:acyl carrier protein
MKDDAPLDYRSLLRKVCRSVAGVLPDSGIDPNQLSGEDSLLQLGLDSLTLVDLAVDLERSLGIDTFPLQSWADAEAAREKSGFTIGALADTCFELLVQQRRAS